MSEVKEVNVKLEKIGVIHYFGMTYPEIMKGEPELCEDCGAKVTQYTKLMGGKRDEKGKVVWKSVCNKCLEAYKSKDLDKPVTLKLGEYNGHSVSMTGKAHKPYIHKCLRCEKEFDIYINPVYNIVKDKDLKTYCRKCFTEVIGVDPESVSLKK